MFRYAHIAGQVFGGMFQVFVSYRPAFVRIDSQVLGGRVQVFVSYNREQVQVPI